VTRTSFVVNFTPPQYIGQAGAGPYTNGGSNYVLTTPFYDVQIRYPALSTTVVAFCYYRRSFSIVSTSAAVLCQQSSHLTGWSLPPVVPCHVRHHSFHRWYLQLSGFHQLRCCW
jgi:hypothetical protein